ncbi:MAG: hypothetical protein WBV40_02100, partial [Candidatus Cybelea sp.]
MIKVEWVAPALAPLAVAGSQAAALAALTGGKRTNDSAINADRPKERIAWTSLSQRKGCASEVRQPSALHLVRSGLKYLKIEAECN